MNYYERHLGDYAKDTKGLSMLEHGAYGQLLDTYYGTEVGIPVDEVYKVTTAYTKPERAAVDRVLKKFFKLVRGVWIKDRCEQEIAGAQHRIQTAIENGRKGGRPRNPDRTQPEPAGLIPVNPNETGTKALQTPDSKLQSPSKEKESEAKNGLAESRSEEILRFAAGGVKRVGA